MPDAAHDFPQLRRALCQARAASARTLSSDKWNEAPEAAANRAWLRVMRCYGDALLQPILGGAWEQTGAVSSNTGRAYPRTADDLPLVTLFPWLLGNRPLVFVRRGRLPLSAATTAFVAESVSVFADSGDGSVLPWAIEQAAQLAEHGYGVWARPGDLTQFQNPELSLLIAAAGLTTACASEFGFIALAEAAPG